MDGWTDGQTDRQIEINEPLINDSLRKSQFKSISSRLAVKSIFNSKFDFESTAPGKTDPTRLKVLKSTQVDLSGSTPRSNRVLRSAARLIGRIPKYDHISTYMRDILRWLPARQRIVYRMAALVWRCLLGLAPAYLVEFFGPIQNTRSSPSLPSPHQH